MLNNSPTAPKQETIAEPPTLKNGKGIPVKGMMAVITPTLITA
jgi:hypothetical protein